MRYKMKKEPKISDVRIKKAFLIFPKCIKREWRWLEIATWEEIRTSRRSRSPYWRNDEWVNK